MVSTNNDEGKELSGDDLQDPKLEEEVKIEAEEAEEARRPYPSTTVASIGVVRSSYNIKKQARMRTGGRCSRHFLAERTPTSGNKNPFHTLIYDYQCEKVPKSEIPSGWNIHRSNNAEKTSSQFEEGWGNNSKSWDSQYDRLMNHIEKNTELIRTLTYNIDELKELVNKLIKDSPSPPKE